jgi:hypothetical protein
MIGNMKDSSELRGKKNDLIRTQMMAKRSKPDLRGRQNLPIELDSKSVIWL